MKGWSCCAKRVYTFDEFLEIPGCTVGKHQHVVETKEPLTTNTTTKKPCTKKPCTSNTPTKKPFTITRDGKEVYGNQSETIKTFSEGETSINEQQRQKQKQITKEMSTLLPSSEKEMIDEGEDPEEVSIPVGTKCKRNGCVGVFESQERSRGANQCVYHPGAPIFHEVISLSIDRLDDRNHDA